MTPTDLHALLADAVFDENAPPVEDPTDHILKPIVALGHLTVIDGPGPQTNRAVTAAIASAAMTGRTTIGFEVNDTPRRVTACLYPTRMVRDLNFEIQRIEQDHGGTVPLPVMWLTRSRWQDELLALTECNDLLLVETVDYLAHNGPLNRAEILYRLGHLAGMTDTAIVTSTLSPLEDDGIHATTTIVKADTSRSLLTVPRCRLTWDPIPKTPFRSPSGHVKGGCSGGHIALHLRPGRAARPRRPAHRPPSCGLATGRGSVADPRDPRPGPPARAHSSGGEQRAPSIMIQGAGLAAPHAPSCPAATGAPRRPCPRPSPVSHDHRSVDPSCIHSDRIVDRHRLTPPRSALFKPLFYREFDRLLGQRSALNSFRRPGDQL